MEEQSDILMQRALQIENNLMTQEKKHIFNLINRKLTSNDVKQHLLNSLKSQSFVEGINEYYGQEDQLLNEIVIAQIEKQIEQKDFNETELIMNKLNKFDQQKLKLKEPTVLQTKQLTKEQNEWQSANEIDRIKHDEILEYDRYRFRQIKKLHDKKLQEESGIKEGLFYQMNLSKQRAWYNIYNDYLQNQQDQVSSKALNSQQQEIVNPQQVFQNKLQLDSVSNEKEFYDLFQNWEFKAFLLQGNFEKKEVKNIEKTLKYLQDLALVEKLKPKLGDKAYDAVGIQEPNLAAAFNEAINIIQKDANQLLSVREDELYFENNNDPQEYENFKKIQARNDIIEKEEFINMFHEELLQVNDIFYMYDKVEGKQDHQLVIKTFEAALKQINDEKKEFAKKYGVNVYNFNPVEIELTYRSQEFYKEIQPEQINEQQYIKDLSYVTELLAITYKEQFPKDQKMQKYIENMPNFIISEEIREKIKKHRYNEEIQEKYFNAINNEKSIQDDPKYEILDLIYKKLQNKNYQPEQDDEADQEQSHRIGKDLDDALIQRIDLHLNENYQNIKVIEKFQMPGDENGLEQYDIDTFEKMKKEGISSNTSDYQKQQHLLYRQRLKQVQVNKAFQERDQLIYDHESMLKNKIKENQFKNYQKLKKQQLEIKNIEQDLLKNDNINEKNPISYEKRLEALLGYKLQENKQLISEEGNQQEKSEIVMDNNKEDQSNNNFNDFLINISGKFQKNTKIQNLINDLVKIYEKNKQQQLKQSNVSVRQAQQLLLREDIQKQTDPLSLKLKEIIKNKSEFDKQNIQTYQDLQDFINIDQFKTLTDDQFIQLVNTRAQEIFQESEEQKMVEMANKYKEFDMKEIVQNVQLPKVAYTGESWKNNDKLQSLINAFSSTQIIKAAQSQDLKPEQQKLALLYDPFNPVREEYFRTKYQMYVNSKIRQDLASKIIFAQKMFGQAQQKKQNYEYDAQKIIDRFSGQVLPKKLYDLIPQQSNQKKTEKDIQKLKAKDILQRINKFDPFSQEIQNYNDELKLHLTSFQEFPYNKLSQIKKNDVHQQIKYILNQIKVNSLNLDELTHSILFQINFEMNDLDKANQNLQNILILNKKYDNDLSHINEDCLKKFYETSLSRDNFEGLAHLINFLEKKAIDISEWNMIIFRSAVDFYLNHTFNINHIFTFTRFYVHHAKSCLSQKQNIQEHLLNIEQKNPKVLAFVHKKIFGQIENIVDMNLLFQHLVKKVGNNTLLDQISKVDPMQNIIDFFSIKEIQAIQKFSDLSSTFLNDDDIAQFYQNNLSNPESFQRIFDQVLKFNDNQYFISKIIQILRDHIALKDGIPKSFQDSEKIRKLYLQIKGSLQNDKKISEKTAEFLFLLFKVNKMNSESLDLSHNYDQIVEGYKSIEQAQQKSNIRNYYMSDTLLNCQIDQNKQSFNKLVEEAVFNNNNDNSESYISSMVKAYMLDGNTDYALQFFQSQFNERKSNNLKQEEMLVKLFDSSFGNISKSQDTLSLNHFKNRYFDLMQSREKLKNEASIVKQLEKILNNCDPDEIECMFMLQAILREEKMILMKLCDISKKDYYLIQDSFEKCANDQDSINEFVNNFATKYSVLVQYPDLIKDFKEQIIKQNINVDLLQNINSDLDVSAHKSKEEQQFLEILYKIKQKYGSYEIKQQLNKQIDQITVKEWFDILNEQNIFEKVQQELKFKNKVQNELFRIKERKEVLDSKIKNKNKEYLVDLLRKQNNNQVQILENVENIDEILQTLGISQEEINSFKKYEQEKEYIDSVIESMRIESDEGSQMFTEKLNQSIIDAFKSSVQESSNQAVQDNLQYKIDTDQHVPLINRFEQKYGLRNIKRLIKKGFNSRKGQLRRKEDKQLMEFYKKFLYDDIPDAEDEINQDEDILIKDNIYTFGLEQFEDELRIALDSRRSSQLPFAIQEFNKIQNKQMPMWLEQKSEINSQENSQNQQSGFQELNKILKINEVILDTNNQYEELMSRVENKNNQYILQNQKLKDPKQINETIQKYEYLLNENTSPIISSFLHLLEYRDGSDIIDYDEFFEQHKKGKSNQYLDKYLKQSEQLETVIDQVDKIIGVANDIKNQIDQNQQYLVDELQSAQQFQVEFTQKRESKLSNLINSNVEQLYKQFVSEQDVKIENVPSTNEKSEDIDFDLQENQQFLYKQQFSREQKVSFMKQALSFELGGFKTYEIFNSFFAQDFIVFGIQNNIAEAVRLGEYLLSEQNYVLSQDLQKELKMYKLNEGQKYREAMKNTGPINIQNIYKNVYAEDASSDKYSKSGIVNLDDPYWREYVDRNYRAQDKYKIPSAYVWDHKDQGILTQIFNFKDLDKKKQLFDQL